MHKPLVITDGINQWRIRFCLWPEEDDPDVQETTETPTREAPGLIAVKGDLAPTQLKQALIHGLFHACEFTENFEMDDTSLDRLARCFATLIELNPALAQFLLTTKGGKRGRTRD